MAILNKTIIVICEGRSERAYLQALNRFLREYGCFINFAPKVVGSGNCKDVLKKYSEEKKKNRRSEFIIWVDDDLYFGNRDDTDRRCAEKYNLLTPNQQQLFKFSKHNFEDFLVLHLEDEKLDLWKNICYKNDHFLRPMFSDKYEDLIRENIFPNYQKGEFPLEELTQAHLDNLFRHNCEPFESSFANYLEKILKP